MGEATTTTEEIAHQRRVHFEAAAALVALAKLTEEQAKAVVTAIAKGRVSNVSIRY